MALNYQTEDKQNFINRARFSDNAGCGYVLKPDFLRENSIAYSPNSPSELDVEKYPSWKIQVKIISGQRIPKAEDSDDIIDPYVKLRLRGHPDDEVNSEGDKINKGKSIAECHLASPVRLTCSYDMGWSKRAEGRIFDSASGHSYFVGVQSGKIVGWGVKKKKCSQCKIIWS